MIEPAPVVSSVDIQVASEVEVINGTPTIAVGDTARFDATATDQQGDPVSTTFTWSSLDPGIATVDDSGTAVGVAPGQAEFVAAAANGVSDTAVLAVEDSASEPTRPNLRAGSLDLLPRGVLAGSTAEGRAVVENTGLEAGPYRLVVRDASGQLASVERAGLAAESADTIPVGTLGPFDAGVHELTLRVDVDDEVAEGNEGDNETTARVEGYPEGYDIEFQFVGPVSDGLRDVVESVGGRWSRVVTGDLGDIDPGPDGIPIDSCFSEPQGVPDRTEPIDDLLILVREDSIDGGGSTLAQAGPCFVRADMADPDLPPTSVIGVMRFDSADVEQSRQNGTLGDVVLHEMGHVLGFGTLWNFQGEDDQGPYQLRTGSLTADPRFVGAFAVDRYRAIGGEDPTVPVEGIAAGQGTSGSHWRESVFGNELMTGFIGIGENPLSVVTIASLADMFYAVDLDEADAFTLEGGAAIRAGSRDGVALGDHVILDRPLFGVEPDGTVRRLPRLRSPAGGER